MKEPSRHMHFRVSEETRERLDTYIQKIIQRNGYVYHGLKSEILRRAIREWLDNHEDDLTLEF